MKRPFVRHDMQMMAVFYIISIHWMLRSTGLNTALSFCTTVHRFPDDCRIKSTFLAKILHSPVPTIFPDPFLLTQVTSTIKSQFQRDLFQKPTLISPNQK